MGMDGERGRKMERKWCDKRWGERGVKRREGNWKSEEEEE